MLLGRGDERRGCVLASCCCCMLFEDAGRVEALTSTSGRMLSNTGLSLDDSDCGIVDVVVYRDKSMTVGGTAEGDGARGDAYR